MYRIEVKGLTELEKSFSRAPSLVRPHIATAMKKSLTVLQTGAKERAPVDQGTLRGSIQQSAVSEVNGTFTASVGSNLHYAKFQEEGTGIYGPAGRPIRPKRGKVLAWKRGNTWHFARQVKGVRPKWYMRGSLETNQPRIDGFFNEAAEAAARDLAGGRA